MRCLYRCFLPRVKGRMCDSGKVLVEKNITSVCWKLALLAPWRWGSASWQRKRDDWYIGIISEGPWMWRQVAYVWCRLAGEDSRGMGREGWHSQSSGLGKSPFMGMFWKDTSGARLCLSKLWRKTFCWSRFHGDKALASTGKAVFLRSTLSKVVFKSEGWGWGIGR